MINVDMVKLEDGIKRWHFDNSYITKSEGVVDAIVERLNISDLATIGLVGRIPILELKFSSGSVRWYATYGDDE